MVPAYLMLLFPGEMWIDQGSTPVNFICVDQFYGQVPTVTIYGRPC